MKNEKPILFNTEMVEAVLDGRKTQTRRVIKLKEFCRSCTKDYDFTFRDKQMRWHDYRKNDFINKKCPYGQIGGELWVRETHFRFGRWIKNGISKTGRQKWKFKTLNDNIKYYDNPPVVVAQNKYRGDAWYKRPSIFMPRAYSRIQLKITDIRVERVKDITLSAIRDEGVNAIYQLKELWIKLWNSINEKHGYGWDVNPWVWVVEFERIKP